MDGNNLSKMKKVELYILLYSLSISTAIDKSAANTAPIQLYNRRNYSNIKIRQYKYLNNIVEQDHRMIKINQLSRLISIEL